MPGTSHPGSFIESPDNMDLLDNQQKINADDEFKTSEHNSFHEEPVEGENMKDDDLKGSFLKGTPSTLDPLSNAALTADGAESAGVLPELRRDPQEEYFKLAILSLKMIHTEKEEAEYIYEINSEKLFQQVKQLQVPFHRWY